MKNLDVRLLVEDSKISYRRIADHLKITPQWLSKLMRDDLSPGNRLRILSALEELKDGDRK